LRFGKTFIKVYPLSLIMEVCIPPELDSDQAPIMVMFPARGIYDRGKTIDDIVSTRKPVALFNTETRIATDLRRTGRQVEVGTVWGHVGGLIIPGWDFDLNQVHIVRFGDVKSALDYLRKTHPDQHYLPAEFYERSALPE